MTRRSPFALLCLIAAALLAAPNAVAEAEAQGQSAAEGWTVPRLPDGRPDLGGVWDFRSITPLERPEEFAGRDRLTEEDEAALVERALDRQIDRAPPPGEVGGYNQFWMDRGIEVNENRRTSLIVDPPDGRLPPLAEGAVRQQGSLLEDIPGELPVRYRAGGLNADGPEHRGIAERCLLGFNVGPPMRPGGYNNNMQLFQTADQVTILHEMVHDFRVIPLDDRPHLPDHMPQWLGSSRGRWEGDTLVVETTNFTDKTPAYDPNGTTGLGIGANMHLVERFTRTADDILLYEYTLTEPETFTRPFTVAINMRRGAAPIFEYACHEGNYGMFDILAGGRHQEREAQAAGGSR